MRVIAKGPEPASLTVHRQTPHSDYDNYTAKDDLRHALVSEQRGLCCYCMGRILEDRLKVEHWRCQSRYPKEQLNDVLNLNLPLLKNNRKSIYDAVLQWWESQKKQNYSRVPREQLERKRARHDAGVGDLAPYCQVAVWLLDQNLAGMEA